MLPCASFCCSCSLLPLLALWFFPREARPTYGGHSSSSSSTSAAASVGVGTQNAVQYRCHRHYSRTPCPFGALDVDWSPPPPHLRVAPNKYGGSFVARSLGARSRSWLLHSFDDKYALRVFGATPNTTAPGLVVGPGARRSAVNSESVGVVHRDKHTDDRSMVQLVERAALALVPATRRPSLRRNRLMPVRSYESYRKPVCGFGCCVVLVLTFLLLVAFALITFANGLSLRARPSLHDAHVPLRRSR